MDNYVRETRLQVKYEAVPVDYIPGSFSLWRQSGQKWSPNDFFLHKAASAFCQRQGITFTSIEVVASFNPRSGLNVINIQTRLTPKALESFLYDFDSVTLCGRMCSLQPTRVHHDRYEPNGPFSESRELQLHRNSVTPPFQLNSITLILQGGNPPNWECPLLAAQAKRFAHSLQGLRITDVYVIPYLNTLAINIYFDEPFDTVTNLCSFILTHPALNTDSGSHVATATILGHLYSVQPTMPLSRGDSVINRKEHDLFLLSQWSDIGQSTPRLLLPRSLSPRRSPPRHHRSFSPRFLRGGYSRRSSYF